MKTRTDVVGLTVLDRLRQLLSGYSEPVNYVLSALVGFILASAAIYQGISPFGVAWAGSVNKDKTVIASVGAGLGYVFNPDPAMNMKYIAALALMCGLRWLLEAVPLNLKWLSAGPIYAAFSLSVTSLAITISGGLLLYDVVMSFSEVVLTAGGAYFFSQSSRALANRGQPVKRRDAVCLVISFGVLVIALAQLSLSGLSLGRVMAVLVILLAARYGGEGAGAVAGIVAGAAASISGGAALMGAYAVGGMVAGVFSSTGRMGVAASFIIVGGIASLLKGASPGMYRPLLEIFAASVAFMVIPQSLVAELGIFRVQSADQAEAPLIKRLLVGRMTRVSTALEDISSLTQQVTGMLDQLGGEDISTVYSSAAEVVCKRCGMAPRCWQQGYSDTVSVLGKLVDIIKENKIPTKEDIPPYFALRCPRTEVLIKELSQKYSGYSDRRALRRQVSQIRSVVTDQFDGMAMLINGVKTELEDVGVQDDKRAKSAADYLSSIGVTATVICYNDKYGRTLIEAEIPSYKLTRIDQEAVALALSEICDQEMDLPEINTQGERTSLIFAGRAMYKAVYGWAQRAGGKNALCGDNCTFFTDRMGRARMILSDGMGTGGAAAVDSKMTISLISRLIKAGIGFDAALRLVNSALLVKSGEESLATVDAADFDLYSGRVSFYKAGAAPTFIIKSGKTGYLESASLPAGILRGVSFEKNGMTLAPGDMIVMVSDGVTATGVDWITSELGALKKEPPTELCERLLDTALERVIDGHADDMTAMAVMLVRA